VIRTGHSVLNKAATYFLNNEEENLVKTVQPVIFTLVILKVMMVSNNDTCQKILDSQRRLEQISEMFHTVSLFHDDVIDNAGI
jgi:geranylgeranyl pyrophosphate synthase